MVLDFLSSSNSSSEFVDTIELDRRCSVSWLSSFSEAVSSSDSELASSSGTGSSGTDSAGIDSSGTGTSGAVSSGWGREGGASAEI